MKKTRILWIWLGLWLAACGPRPAPILTGTPVNETQAVVVKATATAPPTIIPTNTTTVTKPPSPATAAPEPSSPIPGLQIHRMGFEEARAAVEAGALWTRLDKIYWDRIEPENTTPANYQWQAVSEDDLASVSDSGLETIAVVLFTPAWAQKYPGHECGPISKEAFKDYAEFVGELVRRYSQPPYNIHYWELGNEPDIDHNLVGGRSGFGCWGEEQDPYYGGRYYAEMLKTVYPALKAADPQAELLVGGLLLYCDPLNPPETAPNSGQFRDCTPSLFLEGILEAGGGDYFDGVSFHAYDYYNYKLGEYGNDNWHSSWNESGPVLIAKARYLRTLLAAHGYADKGLFNTEVAIICGKDGKEPACQSEEFEATKAYYIVQANAAALAEGLRVNMWYSITGWRASGLFDSQLNPKQAMQAYRFSAQQLSGARFTGYLDEFEGVKGYQFEKEDKLFWLVWSLDGEQHTIQLQKAPDQRYDVYGEATAGNGSAEIQVGLAPLYLEWKR